MTYCTQTILTAADELLTLDVGTVTFNESLKQYSTWRIGGTAAIIIRPENIRQLTTAVKYIHCNDLKSAIIGAGSNLLFSDDGLDGVVIKMGPSMSQCSVAGEVITAAAGISVSRLARLTGRAGLSGLEHISGIPGTLGGLVAMNGGSLGHSIGEVVKCVRCVNADGNTVEFDKSECGFSYRHSIFLENNMTIAEVVLHLDRKSPDAIRSEMLDILRQRRQKFPRRQPNCGSVFKRNEKLFGTFGPPGKVIEDLGLKGFSIGDAQVSPQHANFIVNTGHARSCDVLALIQTVRDRVFQETGIWLDCEVRYVDVDGRIGPAHRIAESVPTSYEYIP